MINSELALAHGTLSAGVSVIAGYPGSPSSETMSNLINWKNQYRYYIEWSTNEKVALEVAIGASIGGRRALVCVKSVGMNMMVDPMMTLNLTPLNGGLVILLGDDPGGYGSQNDQDTRPLVKTFELPLLEPSTPEEAFHLMVQAFELSEQFQMPVIIRITRSFSQISSHFEIPSYTYTPVIKDLVEEVSRFVPAPKNAVVKHKSLQLRLGEFQKWAEKSTFNYQRIKSRKGIIAVGYVYRKLLDVLDEIDSHYASVLKLSTLFPLPEELIISFLHKCDEVLILEEILPFAEDGIKLIAFDHKCETAIHGKQSGHIPSVGELFRWQISKALNGVFPQIPRSSRYISENENLERPKKGDPCADSRYEEVIEILDKETQMLKLDPLYIGDPGCIFKAGDKILAKYAIGSAIPIGSGLLKSGIDRPVIALIGDSGFFHTTIPAIVNATQHHDRLMMVVLDNGFAKTSGGQPTAASHTDIFGNSKSQLSFEKIGEACGVKHVHSVNLDEPNAVKEAIRKSLDVQDTSMVIIKIG